MNSNSQPTGQATTANLLAALTQPGAPRAIIVSLGLRGEIVHQPVGEGQSVMRLDELQDHLNARPISAEYLADLRNYCEGRLAAMDEACKSGGFVIPRATGQWEISHANAFQPVTVGGAQ